jgi:hypothetical protein
MSLTPEQQQELKKLATELNKMERFAVENNINLDSFVSVFNEAGSPVERETLSEKGISRKKAFGAGQEKQRNTATVKSK